MTLHIIEVTPRRAQFTTIVLQEEATDGSIVYRAEIPELPGCMSHGETPEEARQNLEEARDLYLETLREQGRPFSRLIEDPPLIAMTSGTTVEGASPLRRVRLAPLEAELTNLVVQRD